MLRRSFLKYVAALSIGGSQPKYFGWLPPSLPSRVPAFLASYPQFEDTGKGKISLLYKYVEKATGRPVTPNYQGKHPTCTGQAASKGVEFIEAIQHLLMKHKYIGRVSPEMLHIGGRQIIGKRLKGGVQIGEAIKFLTKYGALFQKKYKDWDFSKNDYELCKRLTEDGVPDWLLKLCKQHPIQYYHKTNNWNEARDAICNLYPVIVGSAVGFEDAKRDKDGFAEPKDKWYHAWLLIAINDRGPRRGGLLISSFGKNWARGPKAYGQPDGSIWVDKDVLDTMLSEYGDSYAISNLQGLKPVDYKWG